MPKKDKKKTAAHKERVAQKTASKQSKKEAKSSKKRGRDHDEDDEDLDIDSVLEQYKREQEALQKVTEEVCSEPPSVRSNATLTASGLKNELFLFGGEKFENELSTFYNELYVFSPPHNRWTRYTSPSAPLPRSGHQMAVHPLTGQMYLFGGIIPRRTIIDKTGEFSSPKGNTFYHYSDLHQLNPHTRQFTKIQTSGPSPSARSGHRMIFWRHLLLLFGGFHDTASITKYHNDLWVFDSVEEKWIEIKSPSGRCPEPRSGFTFLPSMDGGVVIGGYAKVKGNAGKLRGVIYNDIWAVKMSTDPTQIRWERRRKAPFAPSPRCGVSMTPHKGRGILFGGVFDQEESEEDLSSLFYNDLYAYQIESNRYFELKLRPPRATKKKQVVSRQKTERTEDELKANLNALTISPEDDVEAPDINIEQEEEATFRIEDLPITMELPHKRFNAMLAVGLDDKLYIYGGTYENPGRKEVTLDDFHVIDLGRLDGVRQLWSRTVIDDESDDEEDDDEEGDEDEDEEMEEIGDSKGSEEVGEEMQVDAPATSAEPIVESVEESTSSFNPKYPQPLPFETLKSYYDRTAKDWLVLTTDKSKAGRRQAFIKAEGYWWECREEIREMEEQMEESGVKEVVVAQLDRKEKRR